MLKIAIAASFAATFAAASCALQPAAARADIQIKAEPDGGATLRLTAEHVRGCKEGGGCAVVPLDTLRQALEAAQRMACDRRA